MASYWENMSADPATEAERNAERTDNMSYDP